MNTDVRTYTVLIQSDEYVLRSDESEAHIQQAVRLVNTLMHDITLHGAGAEPKKAAILAALSIASKVQHLEAQIATLEERHAKLSALIDRAL